MGVRKRRHWESKPLESLHIIGWVYQDNNASFLDLVAHIFIHSTLQTLVTPAGFAFAIWGIIFLLQAVWSVHQLIKPESPWIVAVGFDYVYVVLAQVAWTLAFGFEQIFLSLICMLTILAFLWKIYVSLKRLDWQLTERDPSARVIKPYVLWQLPFTLHCGWVTAATAVNINLLLVSQEVSAKQQFYATIPTLLALVLVAFLSLESDLTVPLVIVWSMFAIGKELDDPKAVILNNFTASQVEVTRRRAQLAATTIFVVVVIRLGVLLVRRFRRESSTTENGTAKYSQI